MFEVSWCVGLYVTILLLEFLPGPFGRWGFQRAAAALRRWNGAYVAAAVTLFVYLMSRNLSTPSRRPCLRRPRLDFPRAGQKGRADHARDRRRHAVDHAPELARLPVPADAEHARAAVVVSRDARLLLPVVDRGRHRARDPHRHVDREGVAPPARDHAARLGRTDRRSGRSSSTSCFASETWRSATSSPAPSPDGFGMAFAAEILLGGVLPLILLARKSLRQRADVLFVASLLAVLGVAYNRMNVVLFAMTFRGRMPWVAPESYAPSIVEWGVSIGLIAATIFLFGLAARHMPVLSRAEPSEAH
jgi:formate dehydrogenase iron-sulfur subunit